MGERIRRKSLVNQLQDALTDAEVLQHQPQKNRGEESYISQCKLVSNRISALQKLISRKENASLNELKSQNEKLKQKVVALELEVETLKQRPVAPAAPVEDPQVQKMLAEAALRRQKIATAAPAPEVTPTPSKGDSVDPELSRRNFPPVSLTPPRGETKENDMNSGLAVEPTFPTTSPSQEELDARAKIERDYSPAALEIRKKAVLEAAARAKEPSAIQEVEKEIAYEKDLRQRIEENNKRLRVANENLARLKRIHGLEDAS